MRVTAPAPETRSSPTTRTAKVLALSLGNGVSVIATVVFGMIAARWLSKHDYATIRQTFLAYEFAAPLLMLGLPNALFYYLPRETTNKRGVILENIVLLTAGGLLFSLFILLGGGDLLAVRFDNPDLKETLQWLFSYPLFVMPVAGLAAVMTLADRTKTLAIYNVALSLAVTISATAAVVLTQSYRAPVLVRIIVPALFLPVGIHLMLKALPGKVRWPRWPRLREMVSYSVPLGMATMLGTVALQLHAMIVAFICSPEDFAVYINGAVEIPIIGIVTGSITAVVFAEMSELCAKGSKEEALELFRKASIKSACILLPTMCFLLATAKPFIIVLFSNQYQASVAPFVIYLFMLPVRIVVYGAALMALGLNRVVLIRSIFDLVISAALCVLLVREMGYLGAPIAIISTLYLWTIPYNLAKISAGFGARWQRTLPFKSLLKVFAICLLCMPLASWGAHAYGLAPLARLCLAGALFWPAVAFLLYRGKFIVPPSFLHRLIPSALRTSI